MKKTGLGEVMVSVPAVKQQHSLGCKAEMISVLSPQLALLHCIGASCFIATAKPTSGKVLGLGTIQEHVWAEEQEGAAPAWLLYAYPFAVIDDCLVCMLGPLFGARL